MNQSTRILVSSCLAAFVIGCGGSGGGGGGTVPTRIEVLAHAPTSGQGQGISQLTGLVGGKPAFLSFQDASHWTVDVVGQSSVSLSTINFANAFLVAFDNGIAVGGYDGGTFAYRLTANGWTVTSFPGLTSPVLDAVKGNLIGQLNGGGYDVVDVATGTQTPITLPANSALYFAKSNWLVYSPPPQGNLTSFFVRNIQTNEEWLDSIIPGDTATFPYALNSSGGVVGNSSDGQNGRAVYWAPVTGAPHVIDSYPGAIAEPGWVSSDGTAVVVNVLSSTSAAYLYVDGTKYTASDLQGGSAVAYLYGLSDDRRTGFGYGDPNLDPASSVAVEITYR